MQTTVATVTPDFRTTLGHFASGIIILTGGTPTEPRGLTCQSFFSLSLNPPLVAVAIARTSASWPDIERSGAFCANVLGADQGDLCAAFARSGADKFAGIDVATGPTGSPRLLDAHAWIECSIASMTQHGDHWLVVGAVRDTGVGPGRPLLFYRGEFGWLSDPSPQQPSANGGALRHVHTPG